MSVQIDQTADLYRSIEIQINIDQNSRSLRLFSLSFFAWNVLQAEFVKLVFCIQAILWLAVLFTSRLDLAGIKILRLFSPGLQADLFLLLTDRLLFGWIYLAGEAGEQESLLRKNQSRLNPVMTG